MTVAADDRPTMRKTPVGVIRGLLAGFGALVVPTGAALALTVGPTSAEADGCTGTTLDPGGRCGVDLAFKPMNLGFTSQTFGFSVSGGDYRTLRERAGVVTLNGTGTESGAVSVSVPSRGGRSSASAVPIAMLLPIAGIGAIGLGMIVLASTGRARRPS